MNNPLVIPTETCIILSPSENEPRYADSAVVLEEYGERRPPSRPNADYKPAFGSAGIVDAMRGYIAGKNTVAGDKQDSREQSGREVGNVSGVDMKRVGGGGSGDEEDERHWNRKRSLRTGTKNIKPGTALVYDPPLENLP